MLTCLRLGNCKLYSFHLHIVIGGIEGVFYISRISACQALINDCHITIHIAFNERCIIIINLEFITLTRLKQHYQRIYMTFDKSIVGINFAFSCFIIPPTAVNNTFVACSIGIKGICLGESECKIIVRIILRIRCTYIQYTYLVYNVCIC